MANSWTVSVLFKWISKAAAPMKATAGGLAKIGTVAKASTAPVNGLNKAVEGVAKPAKTAAQATDKMGYSLERATRRTQALIRLKLPDWLKSAGQKAKLAAAGIGAVAAIVAGTVMFGVRFVRVQSQAAEATMKAAQSAGINATAYQRMAYAFQSASLDGSVQDNILKSLNTRMIQVQAGMKSAAAPFKALNLHVKDGNGRYKQANVLLNEIADKFAGMKDGARKAALAQMIFGESGAKLIPLLNGGSKGLKESGDEAERLGFVLSGKTLSASVSLNQRWDKLTNSVFGLKNSIWTGLLPSVAKLVDTTQKLLDVNREDILKGITKGLAWIDRNMPAILKGTGEFLNFLRGIISIGGGVVKTVGGIGNVFDIMATLMVGKLAWGLIGVTAQIWGVNTALYAFPGTWIIAGIAAVIVAVYLLVRHWDMVKKWFVGFWNWLTKNWQFMPVIGPMIHAADLLIKNWSSVQAFFVSLGATITNAFKGITGAWNTLPVGVRKMLAGAVTFALPGGAALAPLAYASQTDSPRATPLGDRAAGTKGMNHTGSVALSLDLPSGVKVEQMSSSPGFDLGVKRGFQGPGF